MKTLNNTFTTLENFGHSMSAPSYLIKPKAADEIYEAFQLAKKTGLTVTLRGAGRSYNDASLNGGGIVLDLTDMNQIVEWDASSGVSPMRSGRHAWSSSGKKSCPMVGGRRSFPVR